MGVIGVGVARIITIVMMVVIVPVISHRVSDRRAADAAHHRANRTADERPTHSAGDPSGDGAVWVS
jgi:hypothetical protein